MQTLFHQYLSTKIYKGSNEKWKTQWIKKNIKRAIIKAKKKKKNSFILNKTKQNTQDGDTDIKYIPKQIEIEKQKFIYWFEDILHMKAWAENLKHGFVKESDEGL